MTSAFGSGRAVLFVALLVAGCPRAASEDGPRHPEPGFGLGDGVRGAKPGRRCFSEARPITLRTDADLAALSITWTSTGGDVTPLSAGRRRAPWWSLEGRPAAGFGDLEVRDEGRLVWRRPVCWLALPKDLDERAQAYAAAAQKEGLSAWRAWTAPDSAKVQAAYLAGRQLRHEGRTDRAAEWWSASAELAAQAGYDAVAAERMTALVYLAISSNRLRLARQWLDRARALGLRSGSARVPALVDYFDGLLADHAGEHLRAERVLLEALPRAEAAGDERLIDATSHAIGETLRHLGRYDASIERLEAAPVTSSVSEALRDGAILATMLDANLSGVGDFSWSSLRSRFEALLPVFTSLRELQHVATTHSYLIRIALEEGALDAARGHLEALDGLALDHVGTTRWVVARHRQRLAWARGDAASAIAGVRALRREMAAQGAVPADEVWLTDALAAELQLREAGADAFAALERLLSRGDRIVRRGPSPQARSRLLAQRRRLIETAVERALDLDLLPTAIALVDRDNATILDSVEQQVRVDRAQEPWRAYVQARAEAERAEATGCSAVAPSRRAACRRRIEAARQRADNRLEDFYAQASPSEASPRGVDEDATPSDAPPRRGVDGVLDLQRRLSPRTELMFPVRYRAKPAALVLGADGARLCQASLRDCVERAPSRVARTLVVVGRRTEALDLVEADPERPLGAARVLAFVPHAGLVAATDRREGGVVAVVDPDGSLPRARTQLARAQLPGLRALVGSRATSGALFDALATVDDLYFVGHARGRPLDPWSTRLQVADGSLGIEEVLRRRPKLDVVVLHGCATAGAVGRVRTELTSALLQVGARAVLGTTQPVSHADTRAFVEAFVAEGGFEDPGPAYQRAVQARHAAGDPGWRSFRLWLTEID